MDHDRPPDEETPLLNYKHKPQPAPLPKLQIALVLLFQLCEPLTSESIYPYINQLVGELDVTAGDPNKVGYYVGLIDSLFFATEALTVLQWSRLSDYIGRKPVLLIGLGGASLSMLSFGYSQTFWTLVISRCLTGLLNGNIGVMKSTMGDLTDHSNRAEGFALMPAVWALGGTLGPLLGGTLARPHERFPTVFGSSFWQNHSYLLPCIAVASIVLAIFFINLFLFKETLVKPEHGQPDPIAPLPIRQLLTPRVKLSIYNYFCLAFLDIAYGALFPLWCSMPLESGGLDLPPSTIGYIMGVYGAVNGILQFFFFARLINRIGEGNVFVLGMAAFVPLFMLLPFINLIARSTGMGLLVWWLLVLLVSLQIIMDLSFGSIYIFITSSAPSKRNLGTVNGLAQTTASLARAIGPALAASLYSFSITGQYLGGYAVYVLFVTLSLGALLLAVRLPRRSWDEKDISRPLPPRTTT